MVGELSCAGLQESAQTLADTIFGADLIVFKGADHYRFTSDPQPVVREIVKFFKEET